MKIRIIFYYLKKIVVKINIFINRGEVLDYYNINSNSLIDSPQIKNKKEDWDSTKWDVIQSYMSNAKNVVRSKVWDPWWKENEKCAWLQIMD